MALESTIITHGMPYPASLETALVVEQVVRENDAVPATIAVVDGVARVGLDGDVLRRLASSDQVAKASPPTPRRDHARSADHALSNAAKLGDHARVQGT